MRARHAALASMLAASTFASLAQGVFQHPAVATPPQVNAAEASPVIVGHPASPTWQVRHANFDHPAIAMRREASRHAIDPNTFIVQPPAHVEWTLAPDAGSDTSVAALRSN